MSVLVRGMEMPKKCYDCEFWSGYMECTLTGMGSSSKEKFCPLIPVPPHGRLIDADAFHNRLVDAVCKDCDRRKGMKNGKKRILYAIGEAPCRACFIDDAFDLVDAMPTIIEAENAPQNSQNCGEKSEGGT